MGTPVNGGGAVGTPAGAGAAGISRAIKVKAPAGAGEAMPGPVTNTPGPVNPGRGTVNLVIPVPGSRSILVKFPIFKVPIGVFLTQICTCCISASLSVLQMENNPKVAGEVISIGAALVTVISYCWDKLYGCA